MLNQCYTPQHSSMLASSTTQKPDQITSPPPCCSHSPLHLKMSNSSSQTTQQAACWSLVVPHLAATDLPAARLVARELRDAVDTTVSPRTTLKLSSCQALHTPASALQHSAQCVEAAVGSSQDWVQLLGFIQQLPRLQVLCLSGRRTWPPHSGSSAVPQLNSITSLCSVSIQGFLTSLVELSQLAPNLQHLHCRALVLHAPTATASHSSHSVCTSGSLPSCRCFGADTVTIVAGGDAADAGQVFAAAFPQLQVLSHTPAFTLSTPASVGKHAEVLQLQHALSSCSNLHSLRCFGSSTAMGGLLPQQLHSLQQLRCLSVYGIGPALELLGVSRLTQLTALSLTFELPDKRSAGKLVAQVASLPQLQQLALPAKLLCNTCCPGASSWLAGCLAARRHNNRQHVASSSTSSSSFNGAGSMSGRFPQLQQLVFLCRSKAANRRCQSGDYCKHYTAQQLLQLARSAFVAWDVPPAAGATSNIANTATQPQLKQAGVEVEQHQFTLEQQGGLNVTFVLLSDSTQAPLSFTSANTHASGGCWGAFGPVEWFC